jgi:predicted ATPase
MITRVEISGFKTFTDFSVDLAPLSVIAGANASGKSNFLDALRVIQGMAIGKTLSQTITGRGNIAALFTMYGDGQVVDKMTFAIELLLPLSDNRESNQPCNRFRYELVLLNDHSNRSYVIGKELLERIGSKEDRWYPAYLTDSERAALVRQPLTPGGPVFHYEYLLPEGTETRHFKSSKQGNETTRLSEFSASEDIERSSVRRYFDNQFLVQLEASENFTNFSDHLTNDSLVLKELKQIVEKNRNELTYLNSRVKDIAASITKVDALIDQFERVSLTAEDKNGVKYLHNSLSEGTLRTIALAVLLYADPPQRTLLFEEPENGIDPRVLKKFAGLLTDFVADFGKENTPLLQIICTTHSPAFVDLILNESTKGLATAFLATSGGAMLTVNGEKRQFQSTYIRPIMTKIDAPIPDSRLERLTRFQANEYLQHGIHTEIING